MANLHHIGKSLTTIFSVMFALLLFPTIVGDQGTSRALMFAALGVGVIWFVYFFLGTLFRHIHEQGRREGEEDNTDFV